MAVALQTNETIGEHRVETGVGIIKEIDRRPRNLGLKISAEGLKQPVTGWVDIESAGPDMVARVETAHAEGRQIRYRIVVRRKDVIDRMIPFADLQIGDKVRDMVDVVFAAAGQHAQNQTSGPSQPKSGPQPSVAADPTPEPENGLGAEQAPPPDDAAAPVDDGRRQTRKGVKVVEAKPWEPWNTDGSINTGSYAYQAALTMVDTAHGLILRHEADVYDKALAAWEPMQVTGASGGTTSNPKPSPPAPPKFSRVAALARKLLAAADDVQKSMRSDERVDRMDNSHARARAALATALRAYPPPFDNSQDVDAVAAWVEALTVRAIELAAFAHDATVDHVGPFETGARR